jgi:hypothetical protein
MEYALLLTNCTPCPQQLPASLTVFNPTKQGWKKYFIFWDRNEKWEHFLQVADTNPV